MFITSFLHDTKSWGLSSSIRERYMGYMIVDERLFFEFPRMGFYINSPSQPSRSYLFLFWVLCVSVCNLPVWEGFRVIKFQFPRVCLHCLASALCIHCSIDENSIPPVLHLNRNRCAGILFFCMH